MKNLEMRLIEYQKDPKWKRKKGENIGNVTKRHF